MQRQHTQDTFMYTERQDTQDTFMYTRKCYCFERLVTVSSRSLFTDTI